MLPQPEICFMDCISFLKQQGNVSHFSIGEILNDHPIERYVSVLEEKIIDWDLFHFDGNIVKVKMSKNFRGCIEKEKKL